LYSAGPIIFLGSINLSNSYSLTNPNFDAAYFNVELSLNAVFAIFADF